MIAYLDGLLAYKEPTYVIIDVHGVGYAVHISIQTYATLPGGGDRVKLFIHHLFREDAQLLYGFAVADEKSLIDPLGDAKLAFSSIAVGGAALFLLGVMLFKRVTAANHRSPVSHIVGVGLLALLWVAGGSLTALAFNACVVGALITVSVLERVLRSEPTAHAHDPELVIEVEG